VSTGEYHIRLIQERATVRLCLPVDISAGLGTARLLPATLTINGHRVQTTLHKLAGAYMMVLNADLRTRLGVTAGDTVTVTAAPDTAPRTIELPPDLAEALDTAGCRTAFEALTAFRRTEIVTSVNGAKQPETRARRIATAVTQLTR
jgi:hypothetical protein